MAQIEQSTLNFLKELKQNNNREWFTENKPKFQNENEKFISFADELLVEMGKTDHIETPTGKKSVFRIYRDIRFSKDKTPYKTHFSGSFKRATEQLRGGYYFHIEPGNSFIGGGFWGPNSKDILRIRKEISTDATELREIFSSTQFINKFGNIEGDRLKTAPRGFDKQHPDVDLLRLKQFVVRRNFNDQEILNEEFSSQVISTFKAMRPFFDYMSAVLTTDENGVPLYQ